MTLTPERWRRVESVFEQALEQQPGRRAEFVAAACGDDGALHREVLGLLRGDQQATGLVDTPLPTYFASPEVAANDDTVGSVLGPWRLVERIGEGGMGCVYRARRDDGAYEQEVALKRLRFVADERAAQRFAEERQTLARLSHPNIARLLDGGTTGDGQPFLVMELVAGEPIDRFAERRALDWRATIALVIEIAFAVEHAHRNLVVHGDLKPANVLIDDDGRPKLLDFGIAHLLGDPGSERVGVIGGSDSPMTPGYASPEQVRGEPLTTAADIYSLGVMLDNLLGATAPRGSDLAAVVEMSRRRDPASRYESIRAFADDLRCVLDGRPVEARLASLRHRAWLFVRRNALATLLATAVVMALLAGTAVALHLAQAASRERDAARRAKTTMAAERDHASIEAESAHLTTAFLTDTLLSSSRLTPAEREATRAAALRMAAQQRRQFATQTHLLANLLHALADMLLRIGCLDDAQQIMHECLELRTTEFGPDTVEVALSLQALGELHYRRQDYAAAESALRRAYRLHRDHADMVHGDVGTAANDLAACLRAQGRLEEARALHEEALAVRSRTGRSSLPVAESLNNLGVLALTRGDFPRAIELLEEAHATRSDLLGQDAALTLQTSGNLAAAYWRQGRAQDAVETLNTAARALRELNSLGDEGLEHILTNLASIELQRGELASALTAVEEALAAHRRAGRDGSVDSARIRRLYAVVLEKSGRYREAEVERRAVVALMQRHRPGESAELAHDRIDLALCLFHCNDFAAIAPLVAELDALPDETVGDDAALVDYLMAECHAREGDVDLARSFAVLALPNLASRLGAEHEIVRRLHELAGTR